MELGYRGDDRERTAYAAGSRKGAPFGGPAAGSDLGATGRKRALAAASLPTPPGTEDLALDDTTERRRSEAKRRRLGDVSRPVSSSSRAGLADEAGQGDGAAEALPDPRQEESSMSRFDPDDPFADRSGSRRDRPRPRSPDPHKPQMTYVFRGKRIQYDAPEDIVLPGESPFVGSVPRLLFPPNRSPSPMTSPAVNDARREQDAAATRKRDHPQPFPTPQSLRKPKGKKQHFN